MNLDKKLTISLLISLLIFFFSLCLLNYYVLGDQKHYILAYEGLKDKSLQEAYVFYHFSLSSNEFIHFIFSWLLSGHVEKNIFIATSNALLAYFTTKLLFKWNVNLVIIFSIIVLNYYFIVLYTSAERLKFGILFMVISFYYIENKKKFIFFSIIAVFSHAQVIIIYAGIMFYYTVMQIFNIIKYQKMQKMILFLMILAIPVLILISDQLITKFFAYLDIKPITELFQWFILFSITIYYSRDITQSFTILLFFSIIILLIGGDRVNMLVYIIFLYYGLQYKRGMNTGVIILSVYFFLKSIPFINKIYVHGNGFYQ